MVTTRGMLQHAAARAAFRFDRSAYIAVLHICGFRPLRTDFYRHRATGIERVTEQNVDRFVRTAKLESASRPRCGIYHGATAIRANGAVDAVEATIVYHGSCCIRDNPPA